MINAILPGNKTLSPSREPEGYAFFSALKVYLEGCPPICGLDLETGRCAPASGGTRYGIKYGAEALSPYTGEILLGGLINQALQYRGLSGEEPAIVNGLREALEQCHQNQGIVFGHNVAGFDFPWIAYRMRHHRLAALSDWFMDVFRPSNQYRLYQLRVIDTLKLFDKGRFGHSGTRTSLATLSRFWGKRIPSEGANFGDQWRTGKPDIQRRLRDYNTWNLIDSLLLALFSGAVDGLRTAGVTPEANFREDRLVGRAWNSAASSCEWTSEMNPRKRPEFVSEPKCSPRNTAFVAWLTAPLDNLLSSGPLGDWSLVNIRAWESRIAWPFFNGREHFASVQIVGLVMASNEGGVEMVWHPENEALAISEGLRLVRARSITSDLWCPNKKNFRALVALRASLYNLVLDPWVCGFGVREWLYELAAIQGDGSDANECTDSVGKYAVWRGWLQCFYPLEYMPLYCGDDTSQYEAQVRNHALACREFIIDHPLTSIAPASPLTVPTF